MLRGTRLLECAEGANLPQLVEATGWQPHTTRAALTGLNKQGKAIPTGRTADSGDDQRWGTNFGSVALCGRQAAESTRSPVPH